MAPNPTKSVGGGKMKKGLVVSEKKQDSFKTKEKKETEVKESKILDLFSYLFFWSERYDKNLEQVWDKLPKFVAQFVASLAVFLFGITARGKAT